MYKAHIIYIIHVHVHVQVKINFLLMYGIMIYLVISIFLPNMLLCTIYMYLHVKKVLLYYICNLNFLYCT